MAEFGGDLDAAKRSGAAAAEPVDVDGPGRRVAVDAPCRARTCGGGDGDSACVETSVGGGGVVDAAPRGTVSWCELQPWRGTGDGAGDPVRPTALLVVPIFALANAGVDLRGGVMADSLGSPVTWGVITGLVLGKALGIGIATLLAVRMGAGRLPEGVGMGSVFAGAAL